MALFNFDATNIEPSKPRENLPPGTYVAYIDASDIKPTKKANDDSAYGGPAANDKLLALTFKIAEGEYEGAVIFTNLNIVNVNPVAQEIAQRDFSAICHAVGKLRVKDSGELHNKKMKIKVDVEKKENFSARNIIKGYEALDSGAKSVTPAAPVSAAKPSWAAK